MYVINHHKKYIIYMYPKSGCSTLRVIHAYLSTTPEEHLQEHFEDKHHGIQCRDDDHLFANWKLYKDYCKVLVYRDPYARVVSLFFQKVCGVPGVTYAGKLYEEPVRLSSSMRTFYDFVNVLITQIYHHDEHFQPQKKPPHFDEFDQVLEISHVQAIFQDYRPDLHQEVVDIFAKTQKDAWNKLNKFDAPAGSYAHYDFWEDSEGLRISHKVPCKDAMLTPEICAVINKRYYDDFASK